MSTLLINDRSSVFRHDNTLLIIDNIVLLVNSALYVAGAIIVCANYRHGLLKPRD